MRLDVLTALRQLGEPIGAPHSRQIRARQFHNADMLGRLLILIGDTYQVVGIVADREEVFGDGFAGSDSWRSSAG
jgi:hypothetical protein